MVLSALKMNGQLRVYVTGGLQRSTDRDTLARYERVKAVLRATAEKGRQAAVQARGVAPGQGAAPWAPSPESRADVARAGGLADGSGNEGSMVERRQQMATQGGRSRGADGARSCTLWPELQAKFRADVARADVKAQHLHVRPYGH